MSKHGVLGCSTIVKAVVLQGLLAERGVYGRIVRSLHGYAVKVTHTEDHPENTVTAAPMWEWADETFQTMRNAQPLG